MVAPTASDFRSSHSSDLTFSNSSKWLLMLICRFCPFRLLVGAVILKWRGQGQQIPIISNDK